MVIHLDDVTYVTRTGRPLVRSMSLDVRSGELLAIVGPNGAGKSTTLGLAAGDLRPASGRVLLRGKNLHGMSLALRARLRAVVPQTVSAIPQIPVYEAVLAGRFARDGRGERSLDLEAAHAAMVATDTIHLAERRFDTLSGGERQRVQFARAYAQLYPFDEPQALLLDEPTASLDLAHQEALLELSRDMADRGLAVMIVLHDLALAGRYADRVALVDRGELVALGSPAQVMTPDVLEGVFGIPLTLVTHPDDGSLVILPRRASPPTLRRKAS